MTPSNFAHDAAGSLARLLLIVTMSTVLVVEILVEGDQESEFLDLQGARDILIADQLINYEKAVSYRTLLANVEVLLPISERLHKRLGYYFEQCRCCYYDRACRTFQIGRGISATSLDLPGLCCVPCDDGYA